jgi:hypothetical protein
MEPANEAQPVMQVTADITRSDLLAFNLYMIPRLRANWITWAVFVVLGIGMSLVLNGGVAKTADAVAGLVISLAAATGAMAVCLLFSVSCALLLASEKAGNLGRHVFTLREDGFHERTPINEGLHRWHGVSSVLASRDYLYIGISWYLFHVVPARAFASRPDFERYTALARERWAAATPKPS